jgi:hypothetical protein
MASSLSGLSASVTRILYLTGFPKELKTKDIQSAFAEWEGISGGFKIKWRDDTSLLIVFQDASVAKRAYLNTIAFPPPILTSSSTGVSASIRPYDGSDAQTVIQTVNSRGQHVSNPSRTHNPRAVSMSAFPSAHGRISSGGTASATNGNGSGFRPNGQHALSNTVSIPSNSNLHASGREPSPTLPSLPSHPTLNSLITSSLGEVAHDAGVPPTDPAIVATNLHSEGMGGPRIGDPGKRMLGAALGVRHPGLGPRVLNAGGVGSPGTSPAQGNGMDYGMREVQRAMGGLVVAE